MTDLEGTHRDLSLADRVELGLARGYWEENLVAGRRAAIEQLIASMAPLRGRRVLDPACGRGSVAVRLHAEGARVVACAGTARQAARARSSAEKAVAEARPAFLVAAEPLGNFRAGSFDDAVLIEPLCLAGEEARREAWLDQLDALALERVFLLLREPTRWSTLAEGGGRERLPTFDFTAVLREIHLATRYRLERSAEAKRRNSALRIVVLTQARF
jgi:SAM-dependent methyltransferase